MSETQTNPTPAAPDAPEQAPVNADADAAALAHDAKFIAALQKLMGEHDVAALQATMLTPHGQLGVFFIAPDEEGDGAAEVKEYFSSLAQHARVFVAMSFQNTANHTGTVTDGVVSSMEPLPIVK